MKAFLVWILVVHTLEQYLARSATVSSSSSSTGSSSALVATIVASVFFCVCIFCSFLCLGVCKAKNQTRNRMGVIPLAAQRILAPQDNPYAPPYPPQPYDPSPPYGQPPPYSQLLETDKPPPYSAAANAPIETTPMPRVT